MAISAVKNTNAGTNYTPTPVYVPLQGEQSQAEVSIKLREADSKKSSTDSKEQVEKELTYDEAQKETKEMNRFMKLLNADLRFVLHEKTNTLIVQVVDSKDDTVLKEFPPHEFLDTKAKIREYIGILLDKHA
ncbi:MAG: FlaG protein [Pelosinus sp.]|jgi:flagellar protein FlaG|nr:FlaG protein [Pelosinus sp.]